MKKFLSLCLVVSILCTAMPVVGYASEKSDDPHEYLIELACQTFPEYADNIRTAEDSTPMPTKSSSPSVLICSDSRMISDDQTLLYSEYSDGVILLTEYQTDNKVTLVDSSTGAGATVYTINIDATCTGINGGCKVEGAKYTLISSAYDRIDSVGTGKPYSTQVEGYTQCSLSNTSPNPYYQMNESASHKASFTYYLTFKFAPQGNYFFTTELSLVVGNNSATVTHIKR